MQIPIRWKHVVALKTYVANLPSTQFAYFHSTPAFCEKWQNKWSQVSKKSQQPSKNHVRYEIRHKRANAKKALNNLLYRSGCPRFPIQSEDPLWKIDVPNIWNDERENHSDSLEKARSKCSPRRTRKPDYRRMRRKSREEYFHEDNDDHPDRVYQATFGNRTYTWTFKPRQDPFFSIFTREFVWKEEKCTSGNEGKERDTANEFASGFVGLSADRALLGLPPRGPINMDDVKNAFRLSAKKWHPDMHQGPSQEIAEERFKLCVNAYKSLCSALS